jgi:hypothetical protein
MTTQLVITDLTRMNEGRVCVAGYDRNLNCIRPVLPPPGIHESSLYCDGRAAIFPFAVVEYDLLHPTPKPPHTEDYLYNPATVRNICELDEARKRKILDRTSFASVLDIFGVPICSDHGHYIRDGEGARSLGTIRPSQIDRVWYGQSDEGKWRYRLRFVDNSGAQYWLTVTDLTWRYYCDWQRDHSKNAETVSRDLTATLRASDVYLRIGLARGWVEYPDRCHLQITGVYTFPDYLGGHKFCDFVPPATIS